jgi:hypothetical protein
MVDLWNEGHLPQTIRIVIPVDVDGYLFSPECTSHHGAALRSAHVARFNWSRGQGLDPKVAKAVVQGMKAKTFRLDALPEPKLH